MARVLLAVALALGTERVLCDVSAPRDTGTRWALHFSTGMGKGVKVTAAELLVEPPRSLAALALAEMAGQDPLTPGFAYATSAQVCEPTQEDGEAGKCPARDLAFAESGFGFGWFVPMGGGKTVKSYSPMVRYSNTTLLELEGGALSETATKLSRGIRSTTVFAHTRGGGQLALANAKNAPPFLLNADPNHQRAAHSLVQKRSPPNLIWMQCGSLPNFQWMRPLLVSHIGRTRADLIRGQSDAEHAGALFASLLVHNRSKVCEDPHGEPVAGVHSETMCEDTGRQWVPGEAGSCTRMGAKPVDGIGSESECIAAGYTWTDGKEAQCIDQNGDAYEPPPTTDVDGATTSAPPLTPVTCAKTGNRWLEAFESKSANKDNQHPVQQFSAAELSEAVARLVTELDAVDQDPVRGELGEKALGSGLECGPETSGLNAVVGDGRALVVVRARACPGLLPPPLYVSIGAAWDPKRGVATAASSATPDNEGVVTVVVASEPMADALSDVAARWESLATDEMLLVHSEDTTIEDDGVGHEGPGVIQRWCLSQRCLEEVAARPEGMARPELHAAAVPAPDGASELHRPASARTYKLKSGVAAVQVPAKGSLQGETDGWKPPGPATVELTGGTGGLEKGLGAAGKLAGADDWVPPSSAAAGSASTANGASMTGGRALAGTDDWQPPGASPSRLLPPAAAAGSSSTGTLRGSLSSQPPTAIPETGLGGGASGGVRQPRSLDSGLPQPPPPPPPPAAPPPPLPPPPVPRGVDNDKDWLAEEEKRREKAESREQKERDRHKATQERLARDRAFREEERLRHAEHQQKEQDAWDRAAQRRRSRQQEEDGVDSGLPPAASHRGSGGGPKMTMRGWLGAARLDAYHKHFEVRSHGPAYLHPTCPSVWRAASRVSPAPCDCTRGFCADLRSTPHLWNVPT